MVHDHEKIRAAMQSALAHIYGAAIVWQREHPTAMPTCFVAGCARFLGNRTHAGER